MVFIEKGSESSAYWNFYKHLKNKRNMGKKAIDELWNIEKAVSAVRNMDEILNENNAVVQEIAKHEDKNFKPGDILISYIELMGKMDLMSAEDEKIRKETRSQMLLSELVNENEANLKDWSDRVKEKFVDVLNDRVKGRRTETKKYSALRNVLDEKMKKNEVRNILKNLRRL